MSNLTCERLIYPNLYPLSFYESRDLLGTPELLLDAQLIVDRVQHCVLPLDKILHPKHTFCLAGVQRNERPEGWFLSRDDGQTVLELWPLLSEKCNCVCPRERVRGQDEPLWCLRGGKLQCEHVRPRHVPHVDAHWHTARHKIVSIHGTTRRAGDERIDVLVRASRGRIVNLARAKRSINVRWVDSCDVKVRAVTLEVAHSEVGEALGDCVHFEVGCTWLKCIFPRQGVVCCFWRVVVRDGFLLARTFWGAHLQFSVMIMSFQKSAGAASDTTLSVMTSFFTPAARAASSMRVVPVTAV